MSNSTLARSRRICKPRVLGDWVNVSIGLVFVLASSGVAQTQLAPINDQSDRSAENLPPILTRAEYTTQQKANATRNVQRESPLTKAATVPSSKAIPRKYDPSTLQAFPQQKQGRIAEQPKFIKDPTVWSQPSDRSKSVAPLGKVPSEPKYIKDPTVSTTTNPLSEPLSSKSLGVLPKSVGATQENGARKDMTTSQPTIGGSLVRQSPTTTSLDVARTEGDSKSSQMTFDFQSGFTESAPSPARFQSEDQLGAESVRKSYSVTEGGPLSNQQWANPVSEVELTSLQVASPSIAPVQPSLRSESTASRATAVVAETTGLHHAVYPGLIHSTLTESCNCASPVAEFWRPEGIDVPWPPDEYICDGGDSDVRVTVNRESQVSGLNLEDTVAHYDTEDGRTLVTPSNSVCIYSPRFASVRKIIGVREDDRLLSPGQVDQPLPPVIEDLTRPPLVIDQPLPPRKMLDIDGPLALRDRRRGLEIDQTVRVAELVREFQAYEDYQIMRIGIDKSADKARIVEHITAAIEWSRAEAPEVIIDEEVAIADKAVQRTGVVYHLKEGPPCLRIIKLANRSNALPGEIVEFTLRYDNIGEQTVGNVTVIDNLTTRLEYVPGSSQSDRDAGFFGDDNQGESLVLRWEIQEPLRPGDGGLIRFKCKVR